MHFRGVEQAAAKIYINGLKNTEFFKSYAKQTPLIFVKSTRVDKKETCQRVGMVDRFFHKVPFKIVDVYFTVTSNKFLQLSLD